MSLTEQDCNSTEQCHIWLQLQQSVLGRTWHELLTAHSYLLSSSFITSDKEVMFSSASVCLSVCLSVCWWQDYSKTTDEIFVKFCGMTGNNPGTNRLDFGGNPDWYPDPGILWKNFTIAILGLVKAPRCGFGNMQSGNMQSSRPQTEQIKGCLGGSLRCPSASTLVQHGDLEK